MTVAKTLLHDRLVQFRLPSDLFERFRAAHPHVSERLRYLIESDLITRERKKRKPRDEREREAPHA